MKLGEFKCGLPGTESFLTKVERRDPVYCFCVQYILVVNFFIQPKEL